VRAAPRVTVAEGKAKAVDRRAAVEIAAAAARVLVAVVAGMAAVKDLATRVAAEKVAAAVRTVVAKVAWVALVAWVVDLEKAALESRAEATAVRKKLEAAAASLAKTAPAVLDLKACPGSALPAPYGSPAHPAAQHSASK